MSDRQPLRRATPLVVGGLLIVGCSLQRAFESAQPVASNVPASPPEAAASAAPPEAADAEAVKLAFLGRMGSTEVTYHVEGHVSILPRDSDLEVGYVDTKYDVSGDDYAGFVRMRGDEVTSNGDYFVTVLDGTADVVVGSDVIRTDVVPSQRLANPYRSLQPDDLVFREMTADGLFSYTVVPWISGEPVGEWVDFGAAEAPTLAGASVESHDTRLTLDAEGIPHQLTSSWTFATAQGGPRWRGTLVDDYAWFGLWVSIMAPDPMRFWAPTRHDLIVGVDADHEVITEPWIPVMPAGETATLDVSFPQPDHPILLGIEGAIPFLTAYALDGSVSAQQKAGFEGSAVTMPAGEYTLAVSYRACDGNCGLLDPPHDWCSVDVDLVADARYSLVVEAVTRELATCTVEPPA
jgi:hypothetical protein